MGTTIQSRHCEPGESREKQSSPVNAPGPGLDCFVAPRLAMTRENLAPNGDNDA